MWFWGFWGSTTLLNSERKIHHPNRSPYRSPNITGFFGICSVMLLSFAAVSQRRRSGRGGHQWMKWDEERQRTDMRRSNKQNAMQCLVAARQSGSTSARLKRVDRLKSADPFLTKGFWVANVPPFPSLPKSSSHTFWGGVWNPKRLSQEVFGGPNIHSGGIWKTRDLIIFEPPKKLVTFHYTGWLIGILISWFMK